MDKPIVEILSILGELAMVILLITIMTLMVRQNIAATNELNGDYSENFNNAINYDLDQYNGKTINGSNVISILERYQKRADVYVYTARMTSGFTMSDTDIAGKSYQSGVDLDGDGIVDTLTKVDDFNSIYYETKDTYVYKLGDFKVNIMYDNNDILSKIIFTQQ